MPDMSHLLSRHYENVYEPAEDTYLFLDALLDEKPLLLSLDPKICLELGSGSGCLISYLGSMLGSDRLYMAVDINKDACETTIATGKQNGVDVDCVCSDLFNGFVPYRGLVDVMLFNPPYVPTDEDELGRTDIYAAWAGGIDGVHTLNLLIPKLKEYLSETGLLYLVAIRENKPDQIILRMKEHDMEYLGVLIHLTLY
eukprot:TRINITY_DN3868_c0_g1_i5.p1 TRINITY_DN3868_c0_g1~~TRINITY_DN3868_c0_g1_i5.p1  ORF type:complete len:215 (-),score=51.00 TRINITY_DN3868_c0_g1_i5:302-895(-)